MTAHPATVVTSSTGHKHAQGAAVVSARPVAMATGHKVMDGEQARQVTDELAVQGFYLAWTQLTESPVTWLGQVFDGAGEELLSGVGDDPVEILAGLAERLLPHHPG